MKKWRCTFSSFLSSIRIHGWYSCMACLLASSWALSTALNLNPKRGAANTLSFSKKRRPLFLFQALYDDDDELFVPPSQGDGFSFYGGKYADGADQADAWLQRGKYIEAYAVKDVRGDVKDPFLGFKLGAASQASSQKFFRWFCVEEGNASKPLVLLLHGIGSQAYSFRDVLPILSKHYHAVAVDWLGFGFSDKPQPGYGFNYTRKEYANALGSLVDSLGVQSISLVVQGHMSPAVVEYVNANQEKIRRLVLMNPPVAEKHAQLPTSLLTFTNILLGQIFAQDPYKASDAVLVQSGYYSLKEEDKMVYRKPYLSSGAAGYALVAIVKALKDELKESVEIAREMMRHKQWSVMTWILRSTKDRWVRWDDNQSNGDKGFANVKIVQLEDNEVGHHAQEDAAQQVALALMRMLV